MRVEINKFTEPPIAPRLALRLEASVEKAMRALFRTLKPDASGDSLRGWHLAVCRAPDQAWAALKR